MQPKETNTETKKIFKEDQWSIKPDILKLCKIGICWKVSFKVTTWKFVVTLQFKAWLKGG